jgi:hypothetical protein
MQQSQRCHYNHALKWAIMRTGFRLIFRYGAILFFLMLTGCSTANLISEDRRQEWASLNIEKTFQQLQQEVMRQIDPLNRYQQGTIMHVTASDTWNSTLIRWMTPLDRDKQKFHARLALYHQGIEYTFLNGEKKGQTIGFDGRSYEYVAAKKRYKESAGSSLYLRPLQSYFEWIQTLMRNPTLTLLGMREIKNTPYWIVYATEGSLEKLDQYDQYLIYINTQNSRIDYIEFTMRDLMKSYKGVVHYKNHKTVQGILMPFWIGIADGVIQPDFDHYFVVESIEFRSSD